MEKLNAQVFLKTVETGSFKKTADILGYTQAGISYIINAMEEEWEIQLFQREYGGVSLTSEGRHLLPLVRRIADDEHYLQEAINDIRELNAGTVRISTFNSVYIHWIPGIVRKFRDRHPRIDVEIISCEEDKGNEQLILNRDVDCGFLANTKNTEVDHYDLMEESLMVALPLDHPMADKKKFPRKEIGNYPYIMMSYDKPDFNDLIFRDGIAPQTAFTVDNDFAAMAMVAHGLGLCIFPQILLNDMPFPLRCMEFDPPLRRTVGIGARSVRDCTRAAKEFIRCTREWVEENDFSVG